MIGIQPVHKPRRRGRVRRSESRRQSDAARRRPGGRTGGADGSVACHLAAVGPGNNGGDGLFAARKLVRDGRRQVMVWPVAGTAHPQGVVAARQVGIRFLNDLEVGRLLPDIALVIDGITGIGGRTGLPECALVRRDV